MKNFQKTPAAQYYKKLKTSYPDKTSTRSPIFNDHLSKFEFRLTLPLILKDRISGKGSSTKPEYECVTHMNEMLNCLAKYDYREESCTAQVAKFEKCYEDFKVI
jgi:hypothetical protein